MDANDWSVLMRAAPFKAMGPDLTRMLAQIHSVAITSAAIRFFGRMTAESLFGHQGVRKTLPRT